MVHICLSEGVYHAMDLAHISKVGSSARRTMQFHKLRASHPLFARRQTTRPRFRMTTIAHKHHTQHSWQTIYTYIIYKRYGHFKISTLLWVMVATADDLFARRVFDEYYISVLMCGIWVVRMQGIHHATRECLFGPSHSQPCSSMCNQLPGKATTTNTRISVRPTVVIISRVKSHSMAVRARHTNVRRNVSPNFTATGARCSYIANRLHKTPAPALE